VFLLRLGQLLPQGGHVVNEQSSCVIVLWILWRLSLGAELVEEGYRFQHQRQRILGVHAT
jgi:hypothetical protein